MKRGALTEKVLTAVRNAALTTADLVGVISESRYGASYGELSRNLRKRRTERARREQQALERQKLHSTLSTLRRQGFLKQRKKQWWLTRSGERKLTTLVDRPFRNFPDRTYEKIETDSVVIVTYDIPEREKYKRIWLRRQLVQLGFSMLHKSVWMGKIKISEEFIEDLASLKILSYVEILSVSKSGTVRKL